MNIIRQWRERESVTQAELARRVGVVQGAVANWESGDPMRPQLALKVHEETGIPLHELRPDVYPAPAA